MTPAQKKLQAVQDRASAAGAVVTSLMEYFEAIARDNPNDTNALNSIQEVAVDLFDLSFEEQLALVRAEAKVKAEQEAATKREAA